MSYQALLALNDAAVLLNDPSRTMYDYTALLPLLQRSLRDLEAELILYGIPTTKETSADVVVTAGVTTLALPVNFLLPIKLWERASGSSDLFVDMEERSELPQENQRNTLIYWTFQSEKVIFLGALTNREVRMRYVKSLLAISSEDDLIEVLGSQNYLSAKTAYYASLYLGENPTRARELVNDVTEARERLIGGRVRNEQGLGVRRRKFRRL